MTNLRKAVFLVCGFCARFLPTTKPMPKKILTILDTALIQYVVEEAVTARIHTLNSVIWRKIRGIKDHFSVLLTDDFTTDYASGAIADSARAHANSGKSQHSVQGIYGPDI